MAHYVLSFDRRFALPARSYDTEIQELRLATKRAGQLFNYYAASLWAVGAVLTLTLLAGHTQSARMLLFLSLSAPTAAAIRFGQAWANEFDKANELRQRLVKRTTRVASRGRGRRTGLKYVCRCAVSNVEAT